jgi:hypothetical protein
VTPKGKKNLEQFFTPLLSIVVAHNGCFFFFLFRVEIAVEGSIVNSPPDYNSARLSCLNLTLLFACFICSLKISLLRLVVHQLFKSNLTFCILFLFLICSLKNPYIY